MTTTTISLRDHEIPDSATVVLQLGEGDERSLSQMVNKLRREHDLWCGVIDERGRFAVSVYVLDGLDESEVLGLMRHRSYGRSNVQNIVQSFELLATTITLPRAFITDKIQPWHFSVVLNEGGLLQTEINKDENWFPKKLGLTRELEKLLALFQPRLVNPYA